MYKCINGVLLVEKIDAATQTVRQKLSSAKATDLLSYMKMLRAENFQRS